MANIGRELYLVVFSLAVSSLILIRTTSYNSPPPHRTISIPINHALYSTNPEQVHISVVGEDKMRICWITQHKSPTIVFYGTSRGMYDSSSTNGSVSSYKYLLYKSDYIHNVVIGPLQKNTVYYYRCGSDSNPELSFETPPAEFPIKFVVVGDLGQTMRTRSILRSIEHSDYDLFLLPGDLSYADGSQYKWDWFGRSIERVASRRPLMVTHGNHEIEKIRIIHSKPFTAYNARWRMPFEEGGSDSNLYYSFNVAGVHVIMLGSYTDFSPGSPQYKWLEVDLARVNRAETPWIVVLLHAPWYNTNEEHQGEKESVDMRMYMEGLLYNARVDIVFAGHVHAYERFSRVYRGQANNCGPIHITIGDGGNHEGLAQRWYIEQVRLSAFREGSYGYGRLVVVNGTHARWTWHRIRSDDYDLIKSDGDSIWLTSLASDPNCKM